MQVFCYLLVVLLQKQIHISFFFLIEEIMSCIPYRIMGVSLLGL